MTHRNPRGAYPLVDVRGAFLRRTDLSGAILRNADLSGADLSGASLRNADLQGAQLKDTLLKGADLSSASNLTLDQLAVVIIDSETLLPIYIDRAVLSDRLVEAQMPLDIQAGG